MYLPAIVSFLLRIAEGNYTELHVDQVKADKYAKIV